MSSIPGFLTVHEAAARLKRSHGQVTRYIKTGRLAARKIGASYLIEEKSVAKFDPPPRGNPNFGRRRLA